MLKRPGWFLVAPLLLVIWMQPVMAQEAETVEEDGARAFPGFGGPDSVPDQVSRDAREKESLTDVSLLQGYFDWKTRLTEENGVSYTLDYTFGALAATKTVADEDYGVAGAVRFYGAWDLFGRESGNTGKFVWKVENRHRIARVPASGVAAEAGYVGLIEPILSNMGTRLTNLYWKQTLGEGRVEIIAGFIDTTDWVDLYGLASPWTGFFNFALATGSATIPVPDDAAIGLYVNAMITEHFYVIAGMADANSDSTDPFNGFDTFFSDHEYFKTIEIGRTTSPDRFYTDNIHVTYWHVDEREAAGVSGGWGLNFSVAHYIDDKWMPFLRGGYAKDGGSLLQKSLSAGFGYHLTDETSLVGFGVNWGQPNEDTFSKGLDDQWTFELFTRLQVAQNLQITPDVQFIIDPAKNPDASSTWIFGIRIRLVF
jgi:porin